MASFSHELRIRDIEKRLEDLEQTKNAERYLWLRSGKHEGVIAPFTFLECGCRAEELDAYIDRVIAAEKAGK